MNITLLGLSYKTTPLEVREKIYLRPDQLPEFLQRLRTVVPEGIIFSTCNRFEVLAAGQSETTSLLSLISDHCKMPADELEPLLYRHDGSEAVRHVFRVASSLDSMVIGETQILGQLKHFFAIAQQENTIGSSLHALIERAFMVAKKVRTETRIASNPVSIPSVAVELASKIFGKLEGKTALVIGAGKMGLLALQHLRANGVQRILLTNRTFPKAAMLAAQIKGTVVAFEEFRESLAEADIVIGASGSPHFVVAKEHIQRAMSDRKNRPMFLMDIAIPRDLDPQIHEIGNVFLYDLDDLKNVAEKNRHERKKEAEVAEGIVRQEADTFWRKLQALDVNPTIRKIHERIEEVSRQELALTLSKTGSISHEQQLKIEKLVSRLMDKILQCPFSELRQLAGQPGSLEKIDFIGRLFQPKETL